MDNHSKLSEEYNIDLKNYSWGQAIEKVIKEMSEPGYLERANKNRMDKLDENHKEIRRLMEQIANHRDCEKIETDVGSIRFLLDHCFDLYVEHMMNRDKK